MGTTVWGLGFWVQGLECKVYPYSLCVDARRRLRRRFEDLASLRWRRADRDGVSGASCSNLHGGWCGEDLVDSRFLHGRLFFCSGVLVSSFFSKRDGAALALAAVIRHALMH